METNKDTILYTESLNRKLENKDHYIRDYFIIDMDGIDYERLILIYAKLLCRFIGLSNASLINEFRYNNLVRIYYSSSKTGFHLKVNVKNNILENLYYRSYFNDDRGRVYHDILRLNNSTTIYDVKFKSKLKKGKLYEKDHKQLNIFELTGISEQDMINLVKLKAQGTPKSYEDINNIISRYKDNWRTKELSPHQFEFSDEDIAVFKRLLNKYKKTSNNTDKELYCTDRELELCKAIYSYSKTH